MLVTKYIFAFLWRKNNYGRNEKRKYRICNEINVREEEEKSKNIFSSKEEELDEGKERKKVK